MSTSAIMPLLLVAAFVGALLLVRRLRAYYVTEYLFFSRYPLLLASALVLLPILGPSLVPESLSNIFVMSPRRVFGAVFVGCFASWSIVYTAALITASVPARCRLPWRRADKPRVDELMEAPEKLVQGHWRTAAYLLPIPVLVAVVIHVEAAQYPLAAAAAVAGYLAALGVYLTALSFAQRFRVDPKSGAPLFISTWPLGLLHRYGDLPRSVQVLHIRALRTFTFMSLVYLLVGFVGSPASPELSGAVPWLASWLSPLAFGLMLLAMLAWVLSALAFQFDRGRIPAVTILILAILVVQSVFPFKHTYAVYDWPAARPASAPEILEDRWEARPDGTSVMVAASGGGITASYWAAVVLEGLHGHAKLAGFGGAIDVVSSASGGGIGTMYYVDEFTEAGPPSSGAMAAVVDRSGASSLEAIAWGLAYPDLWRPVVGFLLPWMDRGWAKEHLWSERLTQYGDDEEGVRPARLSDWTPGVVAGWRPIHVANAILQETGQRLLLAPVPVGRVPATDGASRTIGELTWIPMRRDLFEFVPDGDMRIATAARLSSTFPYVAPQAAPEIAAGVKRDRAYHAADGGYYDNSGVVSILDVLLETIDGGSPRRLPPRIAIIEIRAAPAASEVADTPARVSRGGLVHSTVAPLTTLEKARVSTQISRTGLEFDLARDHWERAHPIQVRRFVFHLSGKPPLSWQLTDAEKQRLREHWPTTPLSERGKGDNDLLGARESNEDALSELIVFWRGESAAPAAK